MPLEIRRDFPSTVFATDKTRPTTNIPDPSKKLLLGEIPSSPVLMVIPPGKVAPKPLLVVPAGEVPQKSALLQVPVVEKPPKPASTGGDAVGTSPVLALPGGGGGINEHPRGNIPPLQKKRDNYEHPHVCVFPRVTIKCFL